MNDASRHQSRPMESKEAPSGEKMCPLWIVKALLDSKGAPCPAKAPPEQQKAQKGRHPSFSLSGRPMGAEGTFLGMEATPGKEGAPSGKSCTPFRN